MKVHLDRGLAIAPFRDLFREVKVWHIQTTTSDHNGLVVECLEHSMFRRRRKGISGMRTCGSKPKLHGAYPR